MVVKIKSLHIHKQLIRKEQKTHRKRSSIKVNMVFGENGSRTESLPSDEVLQIFDESQHATIDLRRRNMSVHVEWSRRHNRPKKKLVGSVSPTIFKAWTPKAFTYIFGVQDRNDQSKFYFLSCIESDAGRNRQKQNKMVLSGPDEAPSTVKSSDGRLFNHVTSSLSEKKLLQHLASGNYVRINQDISKNTVLLETDEELGTDIEINVK